MKFKLITFNIWHGKFFEEVTAFLRKESADIVCLQEMSTSGRAFTASGENLHEQIGDALGYQGTYIPMVQISNPDGEWNMGLSTFATNIVDSSIFLYEAGEVRAKKLIDVRYSVVRYVQRIVVQLGTRTLIVYNTHFTISSNASVTKKQLRAARRLRSICDRDEEYILVGDMNTPYGSDTYRVLSSGLTDVTEGTTPTLHPTIHKVGSKGYHVDYVFYRGWRLRCLSSQIPLIAASDHLPIVNEFEVVDA